MSSGHCVREICLCDLQMNSYKFVVYLSIDSQKMLIYQGFLDYILFNIMKCVDTFRSKLKILSSGSNKLLRSTSETGWMERTSSNGLESKKDNPNKGVCTYCPFDGELEDCETVLWPKWKAKQPRQNTIT